MGFFRKLAQFWEGVLVFYCRFLGRRYHCKCGHTAKWKTAKSIHGSRGVYTVRSKSPEYCADCWAKMAIRCAWCGEVILPGDPITLYGLKPGHEIPEEAVVYKREPKVILVGCLRWKCALTGADRAGFWVTPGKVQRVATPFEILMANEGQGCVIINDMSDPSNAIPIPDDA